jgi:hypothetical protein
MGASAHQQLWGVVEGAVNDAFNRHPDYLTRKGRSSARVSIVKRVTGTVLSFALQEAKRQRELAASPVAVDEQVQEASGKAMSGAGAGELSVSPSDAFKVRIVNVVWKRPRLRREPRKDKRSIQIALERTTRQLAKEMGRGA